jgi:hypothetical protein
MRTNLFAALIAAPLFAGTFAAGYYGFAPPAPANLHGALEAVLDDPANLVCTGPAPCADPGADYDLVIFFTRDDCAIGLYQTVVLEETYRSLPRSRLNVIGVAYGLTRDEAERLARVSGITYPLYVDPERLERRIGKFRADGSNKPVAVLANRSGTIVHRTVAGGTVQELQQQAGTFAARAGGA